MAAIFLIVEGQTEEQFYKKQLQNAYLNEDGSFKHYFQVVVMPTKKNDYQKSRKGEYASYEVCIN